MSTLTLAIERELPTLEPDAARSFEQAVEAMLRMARRKKDSTTSNGVKTKPYLTQPQPLGLKVGMHTHKWTEWLDEAEGPGWK
jgi:hypothetical protein